MSDLVIKIEKIQVNINGEWKDVYEMRKNINGIWVKLSKNQMIRELRRLLDDESGWLYGQRYNNLSEKLELERWLY